MKIELYCHDCHHMWWKSITDGRTGLRCERCGRGRLSYTGKIQGEFRHNKVEVLPHDGEPGKLRLMELPYPRYTLGLGQQPRVDVTIVDEVAFLRDTAEQDHSADAIAYGLGAYYMFRQAPPMNMAGLVDPPTVGNGTVEQNVIEPSPEDVERFRREYMGLLNPEESEVVTVQVNTDYLKLKVLQYLGKLAMMRSPFPDEALNKTSRKYFNRLLLQHTNECLDLDLADYTDQCIGIDDEFFAEIEELGFGDSAYEVADGDFMDYLEAIAKLADSLVSVLEME